MILTNGICGGHEGQHQEFRSSGVAGRTGDIYSTMADTKGMVGDGPLDDPVGSGRVAILYFVFLANRNGGRGQRGRPAAHSWVQPAFGESVFLGRGRVLISNGRWRMEKRDEIAKALAVRLASVSMSRDRVSTYESYDAGVRLRAAVSCQCANWAAIIPPGSRMIIYYVLHMIGSLWIPGVRQLRVDLSQGLTADMQNADM